MSGDGKLNLRLAQFVTLYKTIFPEINVALEEEEVEANEWAVSWLRFLLCRYSCVRIPNPP